MKRIALACGFSAFALPALALEPDVNLSGTFGASLSYFRDDSDVNQITDVDVENNASNFRITAAAQEVGIRAFAAYERGASNDQLGVEDVREFFGGISGRYGTLIYGRKATDYRLAGERLDPFYNTSVAFNPVPGANGGFASEGGGYGLSNLTNGFTSNTISLRSPTFYGFSANAAGYVSDQNNQGPGEDRPDYGLGLSYANSAWLGMDVGVQALDINSNVVTGSVNGDSNAYRLHGSIGQKVWAVGLSYEVIDVRTEEDPRQYLFVAGSYQLLAPLRIAASYGRVTDTPFANGHDGNGGTVGLFYELTRHLSVYAAGRHVQLENANENRATTVATGIKFVFDVDL